MKDGGQRMNEQLFHRLYDQYHSDVFQFLIYLLKDRSTAEDLSHEVYIRAIRSYKNFRKDSSEKTWLFAIAKNVAIDHFRKVNVRSKHSLEFFDWEKEQLLSPEKSPEQNILFNEQTNQLFEALDQCSGDQKMVIILRYIQQLSIQETATVLQWTESKVKTTQHRAIQKLKMLLKEHHERGNEYA